LSLRARGREAPLTMREGWAEANPRTLFLLQEEVETWARSGPLKLVLAG
jgi:exopolyphosphatase / guanosine-5'-triphosphate,3'-diphosphate pyrophosphatase